MRQVRTLHIEKNSTHRISGFITGSPKDQLLFLHPVRNVRNVVIYKTSIALSPLGMDHCLFLRGWWQWWWWGWGGGVWAVFLGNIYFFTSMLRKNFLKDFSYLFTSWLPLHEFFQPFFFVEDFFGNFPTAPLKK